MRTRRFKLVVQIVTGALAFLSVAVAQELTTIKLNEPNKTRGRPLMETPAIRASATEWSEKELSLQGLSDLLWAANGISRSEIGKRTAASVQNAQNTALFCASTGLATRPRAPMDRDKTRTILKLTENQYPLLNHPVGYPK
ncbi:MAG: hypothetical protein ACP5MD_00865 [Verrucomicrobiia bacterium]